MRRFFGAAGSRTGTSAMVTTLLPDFVTPPLVYDAVTVTVCDDVT